MRGDEHPGPEIIRPGASLVVVVFGGKRPGLSLCAERQPMSAGSSASAPAAVVADPSPSTSPSAPVAPRAMLPRLSTV